MAYFGNINSLFNNQQQPRKSDALLAPQPVDQGNANPAGQSTNLQITKPSTAIGGGGDAGNKSEQGQSADQYTKVNPQGKGVAAKAIVDSNSNPDMQAADTKSFGGNAIADSKNALQTQANAYATANTYKPQTTQDDLSNAVNAGGDAFHKVNSLLTSAPKPVNDFAYNNANDKNTENYVKGLNTTAGLQNTLKQQNGSHSDYNDTGATIDALLLGQNKGFKDQQQDLVKQYGAYDQAKADAVQQAKGVQSKFMTDAQNEKDAASKFLAGNSDSIKSSIQSKLAAAKATRDAELGSETQGFQGRANSVMDEYKKRLTDQASGFGNDPKFAEAANLDKGYFQDGTHWIDKANLPDANQYLHGGTNALNADNVTSAEDAARFQRINELLGRSDRIQHADANNAAGSFDEAGYRKALDGQFNPRIQQLAALTQQRNDAVRAAEVAKAAQGGIADPVAGAKVMTAATGGNEGVAGSLNIPQEQQKAQDNEGGYVEKGFKKLTGWLTGR